MKQQKPTALYLSVGFNVICVILVVYVAVKALEYRDHINEFLEKYTWVVQEFSERDEFAEANQPLKSDTIVPGRVVFFGTQVVQKWDLQKFFPDYETINRGVPGQRLAGMLLRFRSDVINLKPEFVLIETSSYNLRENTTLEELYEFVASMADLAKHHEIKPILTTLIPHREGFSPYESDYDVIDSIAVYDSWVTDYCTRNDIACLDFGGVLADSSGYLKEAYSQNVVEPNDAGYTILTDLVLPILKE